MRIIKTNITIVAVLFLCMLSISIGVNATSLDSRGSSLLDGLSNSGKKLNSQLTQSDDLPIIKGYLSQVLTLCEHEPFAINALDYEINGVFVASGFQFSSNSNFDNFIVYDGTSGIELSFNRWFVRFFVENDKGISYSNIGQFHVKLSPDHVTFKWDDVLVYNDINHSIVSYQWFFNDQKILGGSKQYCPVNESEFGYYSVEIITVDNDKLQSCPIYVSNHKPVKQKIYIYPNPAKCDVPFELEFIGISYNDLVNSRIRIFNMNGLLIQELNSVGGDLVTSTKLSYGTYVARLELMDGSIITTKILVYDK